jgi:hypothetical protein
LGVLTTLYRVPETVIKRIKKNPDLMNVIEYADDHQPDELGLTKLPPSCDLDKALDDVVQLLRGAGHKQLSKALDPEDEKGLLEWDGEAAVHLFSPSRVKQIQKLIDQVDTKTLGKKAIAAEATDYNGTPFDEASASSYTGVFKFLAKFWQKAATSDEAVIMSTA